jgi:hypothetical protein
MVKVIAAEVFVGGGLVPLSAEPVATACAPELVLVALASGHVCAFAPSAAEPIYCFRTADCVVDLLFNAAADAVVTREHSSANGRHAICMYTQWRQGWLAQPATATRGAPSAASPVQLTSLVCGDADALCLASCLLTGRVVVGTAARVFVFDAAGRVLYSLLPRRPVVHVAVCGSYVGFASATAATVLHVQLAPGPTGEVHAPVACAFDAAGAPRGLLAAMPLQPTSDTCLGPFAFVFMAACGLFFSFFLFFFFFSPNPKVLCSK